MWLPPFCFFFFLKHPPPPEISPLPLPDALPIPSTIATACRTPAALASDAPPNLWMWGAGGRDMEGALLRLGAPGGACDVEALGRDALRPSADRKSTRLNSSHLVISYAVFCLKKK